MFEFTTPEIKQLVREGYAPCYAKDIREGDDIALSDNSGLAGLGYTCYHVETVFTPQIGETVRFVGVTPDALPHHLSISMTRPCFRIGQDSPSEEISFGERNDESITLRIHIPLT